jgi:surface carbohydrate biosynthesis protein
MRDVDIVYLYEHAARELDVACAVTAHLRKDHGLRVEIVHWPHGFAEAVGHIRPRMVVLPFCYSERSYINLLHFWYKVMFFNLTWEQLFYKGNQKAKTPRGDFAINHVVHHAWSDPYVDFLKDQGVPDDHILSNGQPAYTLYDEPYRNYFASRDVLAARYGMDTRKRWVFFPENYNWAFYSEATLARFIADGQSPEDVQEMREFCNRSLDEVLRWCRASVAEGKIELIVRPRPSTTTDEFRAVIVRVLSEFPDGFHILQGESVREWILASDVVVSSHSTSLIEASIAGKRILILEPYPILDLLKADWQAYVPRVKTEQEFLNICRDPVKGPVDDSLENWARYSFMSKGDAIRNLSNYLAKLVRGEIARPPYYLKRDFLSPAKRFLPVRLWALYRHYSERNRPVSPEYVKDVLSPIEMQNRIGKWERILT